jgi:chromosome partitioning protein
MNAMAGKVITIAQQKGGAGKTTVAITLALAWHAMGRRVQLIDIDPQGSLGRWYEQRQAMLAKDAPPRVVTVAGWRASSEIDRARREADLVVVDSPPHAETDAKTVIRNADFVVIPIQPSPLDLWASKPTIDLALQDRRPVVLVLNRVSPRSAIAGEMSQAASRLGVELATARLGNRGAFAAALALGRGIGETEPGSIGAREASKLAREILRRAGG